jgi:tetratricopeptide (TPR) repeat protein
VDGAYSGLADCYTVMAIYGVRPGTEIGPLALAAAERALALDPTLAEAHHSYGAASHWIRHDFAQAEQSFRAALELNPVLAISHAYLALLYAILRRPSEAREAAARAVAAEPDSGVIAYIAGGASYWISDFDNAERFTNQALELEREAAFPLWVRSLSLYGRGLLNDAIASAEKGNVIGERQPLLLSVLGHIYGRAGRSADAEAILNEMKGRSTQEYIAPLWMGDVCVGMGRTDEALDYLERGFAERNAFIQRISVSPEYDSLRDHPRFRALLRTMGLPDSRG